MYSYDTQLNDKKYNVLVGTDKEKCDQIVEWIEKAIIYIGKDTCTISVAIDMVVIDFDNLENIAFAFDVEKVEKIHILGAVLMAMTEL